MRDVAGESAPVTIGIVAGEASGDALAATLIHAVRSAAPVGTLRRHRRAEDGGGGLRSLGVDRGSRRARFRRGRRAPAAAHRAASRHRAPISRGARARCSSASMRPTSTSGLERKLKRRRVRTVHFVSPSVWAWRRERLQSIGRAVDRMLALFPFEPPLYEAAGIPVTYVGHPLAQEARAAGTRRAAREMLKQSVAAPLFALLPGSRLSEIEMHATIVLDAAAAITEARARCALRRAARVAPHARRVSRRAASRRPRRIAADAAVRACERCAARRRRRARRVGHRDARSGAGRLPARDLLSRERGDGAHRRAQAAAAVGGAAQRARRPLRRAGALAGPRDSAQSCAGGAEPVRRHRSRGSAPRCCLRR